MKNIILVLIIIFISGCATTPPYTGPIQSSLPLAVSGAQHRVIAGETLWRISQFYNVDIDDILRLNRLSEGSVIEVGQVLLIPGVSKQPKEVIRAGGDDFIWPLKGRIITGFGENCRNLVNKGINIQAASGADILATRSGKVVFCASNFGNFGKVVILDHGDGLRSVYSRVVEIFVRPGEFIQRGALIGRLGSTLRDKNSYLHFEIRKGALAQNPLFYLP